MFTRFRTASQTHVFEAPLIKIPPDAPGAMFLGALGGAYEYEEEHLRSRLLQFAADLKATLEEPDLKSRPGVPEFLAALHSLIEFLESVNENSVSLYSYERKPSINDLLDAFTEGAGANDWALEELARQGEKGRKALLSILKKEKNSARVISAISMLLILFRDDRLVAAVQRFAETCDPALGKVVTTLIAAYTPPDGVHHPRLSRGSPKDSA